MIAIDNDRIMRRALLEIEEVTRRTFDSLLRAGVAPPVAMRRTMEAVAPLRDAVARRIAALPPPPPPIHISGVWVNEWPEVERALSAQPVPPKPI